MNQYRLVAVVLTLWTTTTVCADKVPTDLVPVLKYVVQNRAEHGLWAVVTDKDDPKYGTVYGAAAEDANIAWVAAAAYKHEWSRFHKDEKLRDKAPKHESD